MVTSFDKLNGFARGEIVLEFSELNQANTHRCEYYLTKGMYCVDGKFSGPCECKNEPEIVQTVNKLQLHINYGYERA